MLCPVIVARSTSAKIIDAFVIMELLVTSSRTMKAASIAGEIVVRRRLDAGVGAIQLTWRDNGFPLILHLPVMMMQTRPTTSAQRAAGAGLMDTSTYITLGTRQIRFMRLLAAAGGAARVQGHGIVAETTQRACPDRAWLVGCTASGQWQLLGLYCRWRRTRCALHFRQHGRNGLEALIEGCGTLAIALVGHRIDDAAAGIQAGGFDR